MSIKAETTTYQHATSLISALKAVGIDAGITAGGVWIDCDPSRLQEAQAICQQLQTRLSAGHTTAQENVLSRTPNGMTAMQQSYERGAAVLKAYGIDP